MCDGKKRIYIAGPMTGVEDHNFPLFYRVAWRLRMEDWDVVNPAENFDGRRDLPTATYMRKDIAALTTCTAICMLPGWTGSKGARLECLIAFTIGLKFYFWDGKIAPMRNNPVPEVKLNDHRSKLIWQKP